MSQELWTKVDRYINDLLVPADAALDAALRASSAANMPAINVTANQGKLLMILAQLQGARRILEIGTLGGYSTIWLARALPKEGRLITLEMDARHAEVARANIRAAGLSEIVEVRVGMALDLLPGLAGEVFDFIFIDADKVNVPQYFEWAVKLSRPGSLIIVDNVVRNGGVIDAASTDPSIQGVRRFNEMLAKDKRVTATEIQTVGGKGYDGMAVVRVGGSLISAEC